MEEVRAEHRIPWVPKHVATENVFQRKEITVAETEGSKGASGPR